MSFAFIIVLLLFIVVATVMIFVILVQRPQGGGLASAFGGAGGGATDTAFGGRTGDALTVATVSLFLLFLGLALALNLLDNPPTAGPAAQLPESASISPTLDSVPTPPAAPGSSPLIP